MATARFSDEADDSQFQEIAEEDSQDWPDLDDPQHQAAQQATGKGEASKSAGKAGDQPTQAEGGATAPPK